MRLQPLRSCNARACACRAMPLLWCAAALVALSSIVMPLEVRSAAPAGTGSDAVKEDRRPRGTDESPVITMTPEPQGTLDVPRRRPGLWAIRHSGAAGVGLGDTQYCVGEETDTPSNHLDRAPGRKGSCTIGPFRRVGIEWIADTVCSEPKFSVVSQSVASGDFELNYRIDTTVLYSPPLNGTRREDRETVEARYLGPCAEGMRAGDLSLPGMGTLNMRDGAHKAPARASRERDAGPSRGARKPQP